MTNWDHHYLFSDLKIISNIYEIHIFCDLSYMCYGGYLIAKLLCRIQIWTNEIEIPEGQKLSAPARPRRGSNPGPLGHC